MTKKKDTVKINVIDPPYGKKSIGNIPVDENGKAPSCVFNHETHGAGSVINNRDGSQSVCSEDGTWQYKK